VAKAGNSVEQISEACSRCPPGSRLVALERRDRAGTRAADWAG
jgi:hypothetical protein